MLSWSQFRELIKAELVPDAVVGTVSEGWSDLRYNGDLTLYFEKVRQMMLYNPLPPMDAQIMASRPFGQVLVQRIRSTMAQRGVTALPPPEWEQVVRSYVYETESAPGFHAWPQATLEPVFKNTKMRQAVVSPETDQSATSLRQVITQVLREVEEEEKPQLTPDVPQGIEEEEWDMQVAVMRAALAMPLSRVPANKIGKGPRPCFVCGSAEHSWVRCGQRKKGKCGVCASRDHYTRFCPQRFHPDPKALTKTTAQFGDKRTATPNLRTVEVTDVTTPDEEEAVLPKASTVICPEMMEDLPTDWALLRQACLVDAPDLSLPSVVEEKNIINGAKREDWKCNSAVGRSHQNRAADLPCQYRWKTSENVIRPRCQPLFHGLAVGNRQWHPSQSMPKLFFEYVSRYGTGSDSVGVYFERFCIWGCIIRMEVLSH